MNDIELKLHLLGAKEPPKDMWNQIHEKVAVNLMEKLLSELEHNAEPKKREFVDAKQEQLSVQKRIRISA